MFQTVYRLKFTLIMVLGLTVSSAAMASNDLPEITEEGLLLLKDTKMALVYAAPGANLKGYHRIILLEPHIAFKKNWQRDQNDSSVNRVRGVRDKDMEDIKTRLAQEFGEVFAEVLQANDGYEIVEDAAQDVLIIRPAIINLDVTTPKTMATAGNRSYAKTAGEMTLYLEVYDSETNALIAKAMDRKDDRNSGWMKWQTSGSNKQAARQILHEWAQILRDALDEANAAMNSESSD